MLLRDALEHLGEGVASLEVATDNTEAVALYSKMGFQKTAIRKNYYRNCGRDALVMTVEITPGK